MPRPITPRGQVTDAIEEFAWDWDGPPLRWRLVLLDQDLRPLLEQPVEGAACRLSVGPALRAKLRLGGEFQWLVEAERDGRRVSSVPMLIRVRAGR